MTENTDSNESQKLGSANSGYSNHTEQRLSIGCECSGASPPCDACNTTQSDKLHEISLGERAYDVCGQLPTSKLVGLSVELPSVALPARKPHAPDFLIGGFLRWLPCRESEGLVRCPLTPGLADGQPVPPTASGPVGRIFAFGLESHQVYALPPTSKGVGFRAVTAVIASSSSLTTSRSTTGGTA